MNDTLASNEALEDRGKSTISKPPLKTLKEDKNYEKCCVVEAVVSLRAKLTDFVVSRKALNEVRFHEFLKF